MSYLYGCQKLNRTMETICQRDTESLYFQSPELIISQYPHLIIIIHVFVSYLDAHFAVPLSINHHQFTTSTLSDLKKIIIPYVKQSLPFSGIDLLLDSYYFFSINEGSILYLQGELLAQNLFRQGIRVLRFEDKISYFARSSIKRKDKRNNEFAESLRAQRFAYLIPKHQILIRGKLSIKSISAQKLTSKMILMSNQVNCLSDREISEPISQVHKHCNIYGSIVKLQYSKNNQRKELELFQKFILLYAKQNPPYAYLQATAKQIAAEFDSGLKVYVFDSHNNYYQISKVELTEPKLHTFYSIQTTSKDSEQMIIVDDIRVLNSLALTEASQMAVLRESCERLYASVFYVFNQEMNYQHYSKYEIEINRYVEKLAWKTNEGLDVYLSHNIPGIQMEDNEAILQGSYQDWFEFTIQAVKVMVISQQKIKESSVIFLQQGAKARNSMLFSQDKSFLNFRAKINHYLPSTGSQKEVLLPQKSFYFVDAIKPANIFEIIELQAPQPNADMYILWVDDLQSNNATLVEQIKSSAPNMKISISQVISTKHAVSWIKTFYLYIRWMWPNKPVKLITDMELNGSQQAGADLIQQILKLRVLISTMLFVSKPNTLEILQRRNLPTQHITITAQRAGLLTWCISPN